MISPHSKLLFWVAVIVLPFAVLAAAVPAATFLSVAFVGGMFVAAIADAAGARRTLAGISVRLPEIVRASKDRETSLEIRIQNSRQQQRKLRIALASPRQLLPTNEEMYLVLPAQSEWSRLNWPFRPMERGNFRIEWAAIQGISPFGFWAVQKTLPVACEVRVYPNLLTERKNLAALFLNRGAFGLHAQRQMGKGRDFEKLREYVPGDGYDEIHWKATAKRGRPITKVFQIERTQEVYVIVDASRLSARAVRSPKSTVQSSKSEAQHFKSGTWNLEPGTSILERFVTAALVLGLAAEQQGDLFGLLTFTDKIERFVRAKSGKAYYSACRDALYTLQPKIVTPDFDEVCTFIRLRLRRRALLVFLTSLDDPAMAESLVRNMDLLRGQHLVLVNMLQPPGANPLFSDPQVTNLDDLYEHLGGHLRWHQLQELQKVLQRRGVRFSLLQNEALAADLVSQYLSVKQRQLI